MRSKVLFLLFLSGLLAGVFTLSAKAQTDGEPEGIWFKKTNSTLKRFAYSQAILWPSSIAGHLYLYIKEDNLGNLSKIYSLKKYERTFTLPPVWDSDSISWNYGVHPIMGSFSYLTFRNMKGHWAEAFAGAALNSAIYEYLIAGGTQQPSINDLIITPVLGSLLGEGIYQLKKQMLRDKRLNLFEKVVMTVTDPFEVIYFGFNYRKICKVQYR
ncbi:MAG: DUF3943 domain-containing protein [Bacteroidales bacterium]